MARTKTVADIREYVADKLKTAPKMKEVYDKHYSSPIKSCDSIRKTGVLEDELSHLNRFFSRTLGVVTADTMDVRQCFYSVGNLGIWKNHFSVEVMPFIEIHDDHIHQRFNEVCNG